MFHLGETGRYHSQIFTSWAFLGWVGGGHSRDQHFSRDGHTHMAYFLVLISKMSRKVARLRAPRRAALRALL